MDKILTFSIASYNVEKTIDKTLDSLILDDQEYMDKIEALIIDDGSVDNTYEVVKKYLENYPNTFTYYRKENGGHGSTLTYAIYHAKGKYLRMLDGDDWVNTEELKTYLDKLYACDADLVLTPYTSIYDDGEETHNRVVLQSGVTYEIDDAFKKGLLSICAHEAAVKTNVVREGGVELLTHCMYVDNEWCFYIELLSKTVCYFDNNIYQYYMGRTGQSISPEGRIKHIIDARRVLLKELDVLKYYDSLTCKTYIRLFNQINLALIMQLENYNWFACDAGLKIRDELKSFFQDIKEKNQDYFFHMLSTNWIANFEYYLLQNETVSTIVIVGAGKLGKKAIELYRELNLEKNIMILDNSEEKQGCLLYGIKIGPVSEVKELQKGDYIVYIAMKNDLEEVIGQLLSLGTRKEDIFFYEFGKELSL